MKFKSDKPDKIGMVIFVLTERKNEFSRFHTYLSGIPKSFEEYPVCFEDQELEQLKGSPLYQMVLTSKKYWKEDFDKLSKKFEDLEMTFEEFIHAKLAVRSRTFCITVDGEETVAMCPFADMFNHNRPCQTTWLYDEKQKAFLVKATDDIPRGNEIFDTYGTKSNAEFFMNYGFLVPENERNHYSLTVGLLPTDPQYVIKCLLARATHPSMTFMVVETLDDNLMNKFVSWVRFVVFDEDKDIC